MTSRHNPPTHSIVLQERNEKKDSRIQKILLLKLNDLLLKLKKWKLNECDTKKKLKQWSKKLTHEGATATVFTEDTLGY